MPIAFVAPYLLAGAAAAGGALSGRGKTSSTTSTSNQSFNRTGSTTPQLSPQQSSIYDALVPMALSRLRGYTPLSGYEANGLTNINAGANAARTALENRLTGSGMLGSPAGVAALNNLDLSRSGQAVSFQNTLPLLRNQMQLQDIGVAGDILRLPGIGSTTTESGTASGSGTSTTNQSGNVLGGLFNGLGGSLGFLYGQGAFGGGGVAPGSTPAMGAPVNWSQVLPQFNAPPAAPQRISDLLAAIGGWSANGGRIG